MEDKIRTGKGALFRRYVVFGVSLLVIAFGISIITRSNLGTSPITSVPYVLSLNTNLSLGVYFFLFTIFLVILQMLLLGKKGILERKAELVMQFPVAFVLSFFTDLTMWMTSVFIPESYPVKIVSLVFGCMVLALGICLEVTADVTMISAEYTIQFATLRFKKNFGNIKIGFDVTLVLCAILLSWIMSGSIVGVREGTIIAALITGPFVRIIMPHMSFIRKWLSASVPSAVTDCYCENNCLPPVITISREYGSGGHQVGKLIANELGIAFYDKELISLVADESNFTEDFISENEQRLPGSILYKMIIDDYEAPLDKSLSYDDALFVAQSRVIRRIASQGPCVIVGRCANYILSGRPNTINIFLYADMQHKIERAVSEYGIAVGDASDVISRNDNARKEHYFHYTGKHWGDVRNYNATFDTGMVSIRRVVEFVKGMYNASTE